MGLARMSFCWMALLLGPGVSWASQVERTPAGVAARPEVSETDLQALEEIASRLLSPRAPDRPSAINALIDLASQFDRAPAEIEAVIRRVATDLDPLVARQAAAWVANAERRRQGQPLSRTEEQEAGFAQALLEVELTLDGSDPMVRRNVLVGLLRLALSEERADDPRVRGLFERAAGDVDGRVRAFAGFSLAGLEGDGAALHEVHLGTAGAEVE